MTAADAQRARIWEHLLRWGKITDDSALFLFGCKRLSARIGELRIEYGAGAIETVIRRKTNPHTGRVSRYCECYRYQRTDQGELF